MKVERLCPCPHKWEDMNIASSPTKNWYTKALPQKQVHLKIIGSEKWAIEMGTLKNDTDNSVR